MARRHARNSGANDHGCERGIDAGTQNGGQCNRLELVCRHLADRALVRGLGTDMEVPAVEAAPLPGRYGAGSGGFFKGLELLRGSSWYYTNGVRPASPKNRRYSPTMAR